MANILTKLKNEFSKFRGETPQQKLEKLVRQMEKDNSPILAAQIYHGFFSNKDVLSAVEDNKHNVLVTTARDSCIRQMQQTADKELKKHYAEQLLYMAHHINIIRVLSGNDFASHVAKARDSLIAEMQKTTDQGQKEHFAGLLWALTRDKNVLDALPKSRVTDFATTTQKSLMAEMQAAMNPEDKQFFAEQILDLTWDTDVLDALPRNDCGPFVTTTLDLFTEQIKAATDQDDKEFFTDLTRSLVQDDYIHECLDQESAQDILHKGLAVIGTTVNVDDFDDNLKLLTRLYESYPEVSEKIAAFINNFIQEKTTSGPAQKPGTWQ